MIRLPKWLLSGARLVRLRNAMMVLCGVVVLAYGASMCAALHRSYTQTLDDATATLESISRSSEVGTNHVIFAIDATLLGVERMLETVLPDAPLDSRAVKTMLAQLSDQTLVVRDLLILDNDGHLINEAGLTAGPVRNYGDQPFFAVHRGAGSAALFIGRPERAATTGEWSVMISRPLLAGKERVGVVAAQVPITVFTDLYTSIVANSGVHVSLLLDDGTLMASEPQYDDLIGKLLPGAAKLLTAASERRFGVLTDLSAANGSGRLTSFVHMPARPLMLVASRRTVDILAPWRDECTGSLIAFLLFAVTAGSLTWLMVRAIDRQKASADELRAGEERLQRQSDLLQSTLENMGEGLSVFDRSGHLVAWNTRFIEMLALPMALSAQTTLRDIHAFQTARGDFGPPARAIDLDERLHRFYTDVPLVRDRVTPSGRTLQIRRQAMPNGAVVSIYSDITERKAAEIKMAQAWAQAELANRSKTDFLANMSHELRTPLNAIIGFSEILGGEHLGPMNNLRYLEYAADIHSSGLHLLSIINDVLDMSKIEAGKLELHEEEVQLAPLFAGTVRMVRERARKQGVELVSRLADPEQGILADERAIKQCLLNLLSNAVKFSPEGATVTLEAAVDAERRTTITVVDQGIGMSEDEKERALQPFGQAHSSTTRTYGGTGLGLPITQGLVDAHGGTMSMVSRPGEGTRVTLILPASRTRARDAVPFALGA